MSDVELDGDLVRPRRRRRRKRGFVTGMLALVMPRRTTDALALAFAVAATVAVLVNALAFQTRSPGMKSAVQTPPAARPAATIKRTTAPNVPPAATPASAPALAPTPPRRPEATAVRPRAEIVQDIQRELTQRGYYDGAVDGFYGPRTGQAMKEFTEAQGVKPAAEPTEALLAQIRVAPAKSEITASIPPVASPVTSATRVLAVQRTLAKLGYGPVRLNALHDRDTRAAIERFERDRAMAPSGEVSERLVRELAAYTGAPIE
jgi:peptidoglycan hydrolase-like protein with peptidoglycan-binding domain